jgi:hypothetical protein
MPVFLGRIECTFTMSGQKTLVHNRRKPDEEKIMLKRRRIGTVKAIGLSTLLLASISCMGTLHAQPISAATSVTGGGTYNGLFGLARVAVNAIQKANGTTTGEFEQHNPDVHNAVVHGTVDCLVVSGNVATVTGIIDRFDFGDVGQHFSLQIQDNGEGAQAAPDEVTTYSPVLSSCDPPGRPFNPLLEGNFQIH